MDVNQLRYFILAAQLENLSKAAQALNITQPAMSKSIANLEHELGAKLFDRSGKALSLNEAGRQFLASVMVSVQKLDDAVALVQDRDLGNAIRIGLLHASTPFLDCMAAFAAAYPAIILQIQHLQQVEDSLDTDAFDALLYSPGPLFKKYKGTRLPSSPYMLAIAANHPLAGLAYVNTSALAHQRLGFLQHGEGHYDAPYHFCLSAGILKQQPIFTNNPLVLHHLIAAGSCAGFVAECDAPPLLQTGRVALLPLEERELSLELYIGFKREKHLSDDGALFAKFAKKYFQL